MPSQVTPDFMTFVATNVRARRQKAGLNQKGLADAAGISLRMIGAIEAGTTSASTATLDRIGMALNATLAELVTDPNLPRSTIIDQRGWTGEQGGTGTLRWSIAVRREVETWEWRLEPGDRYQAGPDPDGWHVMLFVAEGELTLELDTGSVVISQDSFLFESNRLHAFANHGQGVVRFYRCTGW